MHPPLTILMRYCKKPFTVTTSTGLSFVIPKASLPIQSASTMVNQSHTTVLNQNRTVYRTPSPLACECGLMHSVFPAWLRLQSSDRVCDPRRGTSWWPRPASRTRWTASSRTPTSISRSGTCRRGRRTRRRSRMSPSAAADMRAWARISPTFRLRFVPGHVEDPACHSYAASWSCGQAQPGGVRLKVYKRN